MSDWETTICLSLADDPDDWVIYQRKDHEYQYDLRVVNEKMDITLTYTPAIPEREGGGYWLSGSMSPTPSRLLPAEPAKIRILLGNAPLPFPTSELMLDTLMDWVGTHGFTKHITKK